ncbi:MAG: AAA family ATPase [Candidatus Calescibacterium sp.]|nr:ATP-binding protein [Candidatus Calescibacterium sp.]MDW8132931.1 AAA family ATPase [Candidatus Calescibacterium sp.]
MKKVMMAFLEMLRKIEPNLRKIGILTLGSIPSLYTDIGLSKMIPLSYLGEGKKKIINFMLSIFKASNGVLLIDEIENGIHYSVQKMWEIVSNLSKKYYVQLFVTTHSADCINYLVEASKEKDIDFLFINLDRVKEKIVAKRYEKDAVELALYTSWKMR